MSSKELQQLNFSSFNYNPSVSIGGNLQSMLGGVNIGNGVSVNSVWTVKNNLEQLGSNDPQQQANAVQGLIKNVMSLLKLGEGESTEAGSEVGANESDANKAVTASEEEKNLIKASFEGIQQGIETENEKIRISNEDAQELQKELEEEQKNLEKEQENIQKSIANIDALQQQLGGETDPIEQQKLLGAITNEVTAMNGSLSLIKEINTNVATIKEALAASSEQVEEAYKNLTNYSEQATDTQEKGTKNLENIAAQAQQNIQNNTQSEVQAGVNKQNAISATAEAAKASTNVATGVSIAPQLYRIAADQGGAASIRTIGSATVWTQITQGISNLTNGADLLTSYGSTIGSALQDCEKLIGSWNTTISPMITSIGSIETTVTSYDKLAENIDGTLKPAIDEDFNTIDAELQKQGIAVNPQQQMTGAAGAGYAASLTSDAQNSMLSRRNQQTQQVQSGQQENEEQKNNLKTPGAKIQFGL